MAVPTRRPIARPELACAIINARLQVRQVARLANLDSSTVTALIRGRITAGTPTDTGEARCRARRARRGVVP